MADVVVNPLVELEPSPGDELLSPEALKQLELVSRLKSPPDFKRFPGSTILRKFQASDVVCRQGDAGASAYYILTTDDLVRLRRWQLSVGDATTADTKPLSPSERQQLEREAQLAERRSAELAGRAASDSARRVATAQLVIDRQSQPKPRGLLARLAPGLFGGKAPRAADPKFIPNDGPTDIEYRTRQAPLFEGEVFGEMSCTTLAPRSATITVDGPCYMLEFLRNIFDKIQKDAGYRERMDAIYRERVLANHLRRLELLEDLPQADLDFISSQVELQVVDPGAVICDEGDPSDAVYLIRSGLVQVVTDVNVRLRAVDVKDWPALCKLIAAGGAAAVEAPAEVAKPPAEAAPVVKAKTAAADLLASLGAAKKPPTVEAPAEVAKPPAEAAPVVKAKPAAADLLASLGAVKKPPTVEAPAAEAKPPAEAAPVVKGKPVAADPLAMISAAKAKPKSVLTPAQRVWQALPEAARKCVSEVAAAAVAPDARETGAILEAMNLLARSRDFVSGEEFAALLERDDACAPARLFPKGTKGIKKDWSELEVRIGGRLLWQALFPQQIAKRSFSGPPRVINYLSRGHIFGEMGVLLEQPRSATCLAYDHPPGEGKREPGRVELVRIRAEVFSELTRRSEVFKQKVDRVIAERRARDLEAAQRAPWSAAQSVMASPEFQELGLIQGQKLLLIDLDRCTRCGDCVRACINTHDDGYSRLFLDGPRFDRFLVPSACRECLNPACMMGCPVGSIQRGANGQIEIRDWCIGCGMCAKQCPYDSIQMHDVGIIPANAHGWLLLVTGNDKNSWPVATPLSCNLDTLALVNGPGSDTVGIAGPLNLRYEFDVPTEHYRTDGNYRLSLASQGSRVTVHLGHSEVALTQDEKQKKKGEYEGIISGKLLSRRSNVLMVSVEGPFKYGQTILDVRLDLVPHLETALPGLGEAEVKLVTEKAVVCDLCSSLPGQDPACVTMCPHDAAMRVDSRFEFPVL